MRRLMNASIDVPLAEKLAMVKASPALNLLEQEIAKHPAAETPVSHMFFPGLYVRTIFMPAGTIVCSKIHLTEHPFVVHKGRCVVYAEGHGASEVVAPHFGVTKPGTRRALHIIEDTWWTTFHAIESQDLDEIEKQIIEPHEFPEQSKP